MLCRTRGTLLPSEIKVLFKHIVLVKWWLTSICCGCTKAVDMSIFTWWYRVLVSRAELCRNCQETMGAVVYCYGVIYTFHMQSSWMITKPAALDEVFLPYNLILRPNRYFNVSSCSSQLQFAHNVDFFQNMLKGKHLTVTWFFFLFRWQSKQKQWKEREEDGFSEAPWYHRIYSKCWCVVCSCLLFESGVVEVEGGSGTKLWALILSQFALISIGIASIDTIQIPP